MKTVAGTDLKRGTFVCCSSIPNERGETEVFPAPPLSAAWPLNSFGFTLKKDYAKGDPVAFPQIAP